MQGAEARGPWECPIEADAPEERPGGQGIDDSGVATTHGQVERGELKRGTKGRWGEGGVKKGIGPVEVTAVFGGYVGG